MPGIKWQQQTSKIFSWYSLPEAGSIKCRIRGLECQCCLWASVKEHELHVQREVSYQQQHMATTGLGSSGCLWCVGNECTDCVFHLFTDSLGVLLTCSQIALHVRIKKQNIFTICVKCKHMLAYLKTKCKKAIKLKKISDVRSFDLEEDMVIRKWLVWQPVISLELWTFVVLVGRMSASKLRLHELMKTWLLKVPVTPQGWLWPISVADRMASSECFTPSQSKTSCYIVTVKQIKYFYANWFWSTCVIHFLHLIASVWTSGSCISYHKHHLLVRVSHSKFCCSRIPKRWRIRQVKISSKKWAFMF